MLLTVVNVLQLEETVEYTNYLSELTYLTSDKKRMEYISKL